MRRRAIVRYSNVARQRVYTFEEVMVGVYERVEALNPLASTVAGTNAGGEVAPTVYAAHARRRQ